MEQRSCGGLRQGSVCALYRATEVLFYRPCSPPKGSWAAWEGEPSRPELLCSRMPGVTCTILLMVLVTVDGRDGGGR